MKKLLFIGSTVVDVIINIDHLPRTCEDVNVYGQELAMGGCAFNAYSMARRFSDACELFSPVGSGVYGDYIQKHLDEAGIRVPIPRPEKENGCCYCFVEPNGERTFVSYHGADYLFEKAWFDALDASRFSGAYFCGIEVEDSTGENIIAFLEENSHITPYFAPGPRITRLQQSRLQRILNLHPVLHLNEEEAVAAAAMYGRPADDSVEAAAAALSALTGNMTVVTLGEKGCMYCRNGEIGYAEGFPAEVVDTIGAGDSHIGALMGQLHSGAELPDALLTANRVASAVVSVRGARLTDEEFASAVV